MTNITEKLPEIPLGLRHALESGECVLFLGAGLGWSMLDENNKPAPDGKSLARELCEHFSVDTESDDLAKVSEIVEIRKTRPALEAFLQKRLADLTPDESIKWLASRRWKAIFTTNYDQCLQRAYELTPKPLQKPVTISINSGVISPDPQFEVPIYHLHGTLFGVEKNKILITEDDYALYKDQRNMLFNILKTEFATSTFLYIGYSNQDPNWKILLADLKNEFYPSQIPYSYRIAPKTDPIDAEILKKKNNIESIDVSLEEFTEIAVAILKGSDEDIRLAGNLKSFIPSDFTDTFEKNPAAVIRLFTSWDYINQAPFSQKPNVYSFLRGDKPNWSLIGSQQHFERDIEEDIFDDLLDYATEEKQKGRVDILLGPAGYGTTTLLMSLASRLVQERAGHVFMLKPGASVIEGDLEFAASLFSDSVFFFIDNSADHAKETKIAVQHLRERKIPALFLLGERLNEWRQSYTKIIGQEFLIDQLSDSEIDRLLECLSENNELGILEPLEQDVRFAAIKSKYKNELLVVLREATEGISFDAILESEFRSLGDQLSKDLYLYVCCFYQHGAYVRDNLLAKLLNISLVEMYDETKDSTDGVVIYDCVNVNRGFYAARARHSKIAAVVWERCCEASQGDYLLHSIIKELNVTYKTDKDAFEYFIRSDRMIDSISTVDGRTKFFELACRKEPDNPYVRQHFARMLSRAENCELALGQIEKAIKLNSSNRILYHTKGGILARLAFEIESQEIARKRLIQSEACFKKGIEFAPKDDYCYHGLAKLYFGWSRRDSVNPEESTDYISKSEEVIGQGLRMSRSRDRLWILSAEIQKFLGDNPAHLDSLKKAVNASQESIVARYLLGRTYRRAKQYKEALETLKPIILESPDEFRTSVEYALSLVSLGKSYQEAIAILNLSTLYGLSDPRFIATIGGMYFCDGKFSEADAVFERAKQRPFTAAEKNTIQFRPPDPNNLKWKIRLKGKVVNVGAGSSVIECVGYPRLLCPGSKFGKLLMEKGLKVSFSLVFTAVGALAIKPVVDK